MSAVPVCRSSASLVSLNSQQPHVLDGDDSLVGEGAQQLDVMIGEQSRFASRAGDEADECAVAHQRRERDAAPSARTSKSLGFQIGAAIGGLTPFAATTFMVWTGGATWPISVYLIVLAAITWLAAAAAPETASKALN